MPDTDTEGMKMAQEIAHEAEEVARVHLDPVLGDTSPEDATADATHEEANVWIFAFGSNMCKSVLQGRRMIKPAESAAARLPGWVLTFKQPGLPYREPGFASVEPMSTAHYGDGSAVQEVHGVAHRITAHEWIYYKESEGAAGHSDQGYGVVEVEVETYDGRTLPAFTLRTQPKTVARLKGRNALPSKRYLTLLRTGAAESGLSEQYRAYLDDLKHYSPLGIGRKLGAFVTSILAYALLFPMFGTMRLYRKMRGLKSISAGGRLGRLQSSYFHFVFGLAWGFHDVVAPYLGSGCCEHDAEEKLKAA